MNITTPMAVGFNGTPGDSTGPPIYVSQPHFCLSDPLLAAGVEGLRCNMSNHQTYVDVEPITGAEEQCGGKGVTSDKVWGMASAASPLASF